MPHRSLINQLEHTRRLLKQLQQSVATLPPSCRKTAEQELLNFAHSLEACLRESSSMETRSDSRTGGNEGEDKSPQAQTATWLEVSLSEARVGTWRWNLISGKMDWSAEMYRLHGFESAMEPMDFDCYIDLVHPDDRDRVAEKLKSSRNQGSAFVDEYRIITTNGDTRWVNTAAEVERDTSGRLVFVGGVSQDVTDRRLAEKDLHEARDREKAKAAELEAILDAVPALVWISRDPECREMTGSRYGYEFLGMWKGANLSKSAPAPELELQRFKNIKNGREIPANELPIQMAAATGTEFRDFEFDIMLDDGRRYSLIGNAVPLRDQNGRCSGAVGAFIDITERKRFEEEILQDEAREQARSTQLQAVIDAVPTPIFLSFDPEGRVITGNRAAYRVMHAELGANLSRIPTGRSESSVLKVLYHGKELPPHETPMMRAQRTGKPADDYEVQLLFEDGTQSLLWGSACPLLDETGIVYGSVGSFVDMTAKREAEETLRRHAERDAYRIELADALRRLTDPEEIKETAAQVLGKRLKASRVFYVAVEPGGEDVTLKGGYIDGVQALKGRFHLADFSRNLPKDHPKGRPYIITDIPHDTNLSEEQRSAYMDLDVQAHVDVPLVINDQFVALLAVHQSTPREWSEEEVALMIETAERTWASVQRAHAEAALRESEARFHISIESLLESFILYSTVRQTRKDGKPGRIIDLRYEYVNASACRINQSTKENMLGNTLLKVLPGPIGKELFKRYLKVLRSGKPLMERALLGDPPESARFFDIHAVKLGDGLVVTRADVTEQVLIEKERQQAITQMEIHQRLSEQSERDRQSYARELHDGPIQSLASIAYTIQYLKEVFRDPLLGSELTQIGSTVRGTIQELRQVISELRPPSVLRYGLTRAIQMQAEEMVENIPEIHWHHRLAADQRRIPAPVSLAIFRIYQEAINNIIRHSKATQAWINLQVQNDRVILDVRDNGKGLPPKHDFNTLTLNEHFGLAGMSERTELIGGKLEITSIPEAGTRIRVTAPFQKQNRDKGPISPG